MNYKSHPNKKTMPQRMARKRARRDVFVANSKMAKARRKAKRVSRQEAAEE